MAIKVNKKRVIAKLKKALAKNAKVRALKQNVLEHGLFAPTQFDIEEELALSTKYTADATRDLTE